MAGDDTVVGELVDGEDAAPIVKRGGRPSLFTEELGERLVKSAKENPSIRSCARLNGISPSTLEQWLAKGEQGHPTYADFSIRFRASRDFWKDKCIANMMAIADDPSQGAAAVRANDFLLRKLFGQEFGDQIYVSTMIRKEADGFDLTILSQVQLREFQKMVRALKAHNEGADEAEVKRLVSKINFGEAEQEDSDATDS